MTNHLALIKTSESRISPASHRGRNIVARCSGGDPLWHGVAQGRVRYERFWALLATVGGEAVGVVARRFGDPRGPTGNPPRIAPSDSRRSLHDARVPPVDSMDDPSPGSMLDADPGLKFTAD